ncbi:MAG TPA: site-specific DNA-methyltransferase [Pseudonocardia sp.]
MISSPSPQTTGTSPDRDGRSTDGAVRATSSAWSTTSVCGSCGASSRSVSHATVKPLGLMRWLVRLVTLPGGTVLDPFAGSGTTGQAAALEGFPCVLVEFEPEHIPLIVKRLTGLNPEPVPSEVAS